MVSAKVESMGMNPGSGDLLVILKAETGKVLPIVIGALETQNIMIFLSGEKPPRPLGPDLFVNTLDLLGVKILRLEIVELKEGTFYGRLVLKERGLEYDVDCRPSDGMAIALRSGADILVDETVLQDAGIEESRLNRGGSTPQA